MYERILVPLDGSELAQVALPYVEELAGRLGSEVTLLHVCEPGKHNFDYMHQLYVERMTEVVEKGISKYLQKPQGKAIKIGTKILMGDPAEEILEYADKQDIGLIIMATHGRSGIKRWAMGSVAAKVVRAAKQPVALIRAKGARPDVREKGTLNRVLIPLDGSKESEVVIPFIEELATRLKTEVVLLRVLVTGYYTVTSEGYDYAIYPEKQIASDRVLAKAYLDKVVTRLEQKGVSVKSEVRLGAAADGIIELADQASVDLVAMSTHGRSGVGRWVFGSVAEKVLHAGNTPLLLVRAPEGTTA